jgi:phospholipase/carboxylesterase
MRKLAKVYCLDDYHDDNAPWVILFHGFGADAADLQTLKDYIPTQKKLNWLFPQGLLEVPIGPGWTGRAWWHIDMLGMQRNVEAGIENDFSSFKPEGLEKVRAEIFKMIEELKVPWSKIFLGGFSQGAMLATDIYLHAPETPAGLILMSGSLLNKEELKPLVQSRAGEKFFQSHGDQDSVLQIKGARRLESFLNQGGMKGGLQNFPGGHEIPPKTIQKIGAYLDQQISAKSL